MRAYQHAWSKDLFFVCDEERGFWIVRCEDGRLQVNNSIYKQRDAESFVVNKVYHEVPIIEIFNP